MSDINVNVTDQIINVDITDQIIEVNVNNAPGPAGPGVPAGGTAGQILIKESSTDYDTGWSTTNADLGEFGLKAGYLQVDITPTNTPGDQGTMYWDDQAETVALVMNGTVQKVGEDVFYHVINQTGSSIPKGTAVRFAGTDGNSGKILIAPFLANGTYPSFYYMGITSETIANGQPGKVYEFGKIRGVNTSAYQDGDILYASTTVAGGFQTTAPTAPNNIIVVAAVINAANNGTLMIRATITDSGTNIYNSNGTLTGNRTVTMGNNTLSFEKDLLIHGLTVGRGSGAKVNNTVLGTDALASNTTGEQNIAIGRVSLTTNTTGINNTAIGWAAMQFNLTGSYNTAVGYNTLSSNTSGGGNSAFGDSSLDANTTGNNNTALGYLSLLRNTTGSNNISIGTISGNSVNNINGSGNFANTISNNSIYIGYDTKALADNQTNQIVIGHQAIGDGSNTTVIGNSSTTSTKLFGALTVGTVNASTTDTDRFLVSDSGVIKYRTGSELLSDIGGQAALTNPITGTGTSGQVAYFTGSTTQAGSNNLFWDNANGRLGIGTNAPDYKLTAIDTGTLFTLRLRNTNSAGRAGLFMQNDSTAYSGFGTYGTTFITSSLQNNTVFFSSHNFQISAGDLTGTGNILFSTGVSSTNLRMQLFSTGNLLLQNGGTFTDGGQRLQVQGTTLLNGFATIGGSVTASSAIARGTLINTSLSAAANNDVLVGLDVAPTFTNGAFTGVQNYGLRVIHSTNSQIYTSGSASSNANPFTIYWARTTNVTMFFGAEQSANASVGSQGWTGTLTNHDFSIKTNDTGKLRVFANGNVLVGTGATDGGFKLDVNGTARVQSTLDIGTVSADGYTRVSGANIEIGNGRTSNGYAYIDLVGDTTYTDYALRIIRNNTGANAATDIQHRGTGAFNLQTIDAAPLVFYTGGNTSVAERMRIFANGNVSIASNVDAGTKLYVNGTVRIQSTLNVNSTSLFDDNVSVTKNQNAATIINLTNSTSGTASQAQYAANSDASSGGAAFGKYSTTTTPYKTVNSKDAYIFNANGGDISILNDFATGKIKFAAGGSSTVQWQIDASGNLEAANGENIIFGTTTGTKIGTATSQKLSLWNATPDVQPTTAITAAAFVANTSGIVDDTATFGGYTIGQIVAALKRIGALA